MFVEVPSSSVGKGRVPDADGEASDGEAGSLCWQSGRGAESPRFVWERRWLLGGAPSPLHLLREWGMDW